MEALTREQAFNIGSAARLAGFTLASNPYKDYILARYWQRGWLDVDRFWGRDAKWPIKRLPRVRQMVSAD